MKHGIPLMHANFVSVARSIFISHVFMLICAAFPTDPLFHLHLLSPKGIRYRSSSLMNVMISEGGGNLRPRFCKVESISDFHYAVIAQNVIYFLRDFMRVGKKGN